MGKCSPIQKQASGITYTGDWTGLSGATEVQLATVSTAGYFKQGYPIAKSDGTVLVPDIDFTYDARLDSAGGGSVNIYDPGVAVTLSTLKYLKICASNGANIVEASGGGYTQILAKKLPSASNPAASIAWVDPVSGSYKGIGGVEVHQYLHSYWKMDAGSGANEPNVIQSSGYDLTNAGTVSSAAGKLGTSRGGFNNSNYLRCNLGNSNSTPYDSQVFIIEAWFKTGSSGILQRIFRKHNGTNGKILGITDSNNMYLDLSGSVIYSSGVNVADGNWHYVVAGVLVTSGANNRRIYVNGVLRGQSTGTAHSVPSADMTIGGFLDSLHSFSGSIDDVAYWNTVPADWATVEAIIAQRYNSGAGLGYGQGAIQAGYYYLAAASDPAKVALASAAGTNVKIVL